MENLVLEAHGLVRAHPAEKVCGDAVHIATRGGVLQVALADGLGHGPEAEAASRRFVEIADGHADAPLEALFRAADQALRATRGCAALVVRFDAAAGALSGMGVGNCQLRAAAADRLMGHCTAGIVGRGRLHLRALQARLSEGDVYLLHTDGIRSRVDVTHYVGLPADQACRVIVGSESSERDDAGCAVVRVGAP
jgi:negative regulator of sigma-B (phosphoserine phosphatase)